MENMRKINCYTKVLTSCSN